MDANEKALFEQAYLPAFIQKCASYGVQFPNEEALNTALETTKMIIEAAEAQQVGVIKAAAEAIKTK